MVKLELFGCLFYEIDNEEKQCSNGAKSHHMPWHGQGVGWGNGDDTFMVKKIQHHDKGVVEKMGADIDKDRPGEYEQIAEHNAHYKPRNKPIHIAMSQGEKQCRHKHCSMLVSPPIVKNLLNTATEKEFLAYGRHQCHNQQLEAYVAEGGEREQTVDHGLTFGGHLTGVGLQWSKIPAVIPRIHNIVERSEKQHNDHRHKCKPPISPLETKFEIFCGTGYIHNGKQQYGQQEG